MQAKIQIRCDSDRLANILDELTKLRSLPKLRDVPLNLPDSPEEWFRVKSLTARRTGEVTVRFYPAKCLRDALRTLRARKRKLLSVKRSKHSG